MSTHPGHCQLPATHRADGRERKGRKRHTTSPHMFSAARRGNGIRVAIETPTWKMRRGNDIAPAERWMSRKTLRETPKTSARKLR